MSGNETRGEMSIELEGVSYVLRPSFGAISAFETQTGMGLVALLNAASDGSMRLGTAVIILTECLKAGLEAAGNPMAGNFNSRRIGELMMGEEGGFLLALKRIELLLMFTATGGYTASGEVKATGTTTPTPAAA